MPTTGKIFVSYRRADSTADAQALYGRLRDEFGEQNVFIDLTGIDPGEDFVDLLARQLDGCEVLIAIIGSQWAEKMKLAGEGDFVRLELRTALTRSLKIIPVLVHGARPLRAEDLPDDIRSMARRQALNLDYTKFDADVGRLARVIRAQLAKPRPSVETGPIEPPAGAASADQSADPAAVIPEPAAPSPAQAVQQPAPARLEVQPQRPVTGEPPARTRGKPWRRTLLATLAILAGGMAYVALRSSESYENLLDLVIEPRGGLTAIGDHGSIVHSSDGGATWAKASAPKTEVTLSKILFEAKGGWIAVGQGRILLSTDRGAIWSMAKTGTHYALNAVAVAPNGVLVAVGEHGTIVRSVDGGMDWSEVSRTGTAAHLNAVTVTATGTLIAAGAEGTIVRSSDGGVSWQAVAFPAADKTLLFVSAFHGNLLLALAQDLIARSTDDGLTWTVTAVLEASRDDRSLIRAVAEPRGALMALGKSGTVLRSANDGREWTYVLSSGYDTPSAVASSAEQALILVGASGSIFRSIDHGASWTKMPTERYENLNDVALEPNGDLVAVGDRGTIVRSTDGGIRWVPVRDEPSR